MVRIIKTVFFCIVILMLGLLSLWLTIPYWLSPVSQWFLPENTALSISERPKLSKNGLTIAGLQLRIKQCTALNVEQVTLNYQHSQFLINTARSDVDSQCLAQWPATAEQENTNSPLSLISLQQLLPPLIFTVNDLNISPWSVYHGQLIFEQKGEQQKLSYQSERLNLIADIDAQQQLTITTLQLLLPEANERLSLNGNLSIPLTLNVLPEQGDIQAEFSSHYFAKPLIFSAVWQKKVGLLTVKEQDATASLLYLPWYLVEQKLTIDKGYWIWPYFDRPLGGGVNLILSNWAADYHQAQIEGRLNLLTNGHGGKANLVLSFGPDQINLTDNNIRFQLTGKAAQDNLAGYITIPGLLTHKLYDPVIKLGSGSLLRVTGKPTTDITLQEMRFPLAGIELTTSGINGRLQSIVNATHRQWGTFKLHLDGRAQQFLPDSGVWYWKFWGNGNLPTLKAKWDVAGYGRWQDYLVNIAQMSTGFNSLSYGGVVVTAPRYSLTQPLIWHRDSQQFNTAMKAEAAKVTFSNQGYLPATELTLDLAGSSPNDFNWRGQLIAKPIGPIRLTGRWDGTRLRGEAWWPKQSLKVFQSLLAPDTDIKIRNGTLNAQAAFSAAEKQGFEAGGHVVVTDGSLWLKDGELSGLDFTGSYLFKNHSWILGTKAPIKLRIAKLVNLFDMRNITANLQGNYPYNQKKPLTLSHVAVDILDGKLSMSDLRLPQQQPAILKLEGLDLSELFTVLKPKQVAMSGKVNGELPLYINNPQWLIKDGWLENAGNLTLRLDKDLIDAIADDSAITGAVMDWLRYMEISRSRADVDVSNLGTLTMTMQIKGVNSVKSKIKPVILNYRHEENIFQLWQSLRFGANVQDWVEQQLNQ